MAELEKQVRRVWRRLNFERFVNILVWCWVGALALALCWVAVEKVWRPIVEPWWITVLASLGVGTALAGVIWFFTRRSAVDAAMALDRAFGLKERVSTSLTLPADLRQTSAGMALVTDAMQRVGSIDVSEKFGFRMPRTAWLPLVPAVLVFCLATFVGQLGGGDKAQASAGTPKEVKQVQQSTQILAKRFEEQKEKAEKEGFAEAEQLLAQFQKAAKDISENRELDQKKALSEMHTIQDALKDRREKLGSAEQMQRQLEKMQASSQKGPAEKLQESLRQGDFKKAAQEISKLAEELRSGKMDAAQKKALEKQLSQMKEQLQKLASQEQRRKELQKAGLPPEVLKQEMAKLDAQAKQLQKLQELAQKLEKAQEAMKNGDMAKAAEALEMSQKDLEQLKKDLEEMEMLQDALNDLAEMKNAMVCKNCDGFGCSLCGSDRGRGNRNGDGGRGFARGATGSREEEEDTTKSFSTRTRQKLKPGGKVEITDLVDGKQLKGESQIDAGETIAAGHDEATDALSKQRIPRDYSKHAQEYFKQVRGSN